MTWSVSASGPKADVAKRVVEQVSSYPPVAEALVKLVHAQVGPDVSITGSGSTSSTSLSITSYTAPVSAG